MFVGGIRITPLDADRFVIAYDNGQGRAIMGTVDGADVVIGPISTFNAYDTGVIDVVALSPTLLVVAYDDDGTSFGGRSSPGAIVGDQIIFGTETILDNGFQVSKIDLAALTNQ